MMNLDKSAFKLLFASLLMVFPISFSSYIPTYLESSYTADFTTVKYPKENPLLNTGSKATNVVTTNKVDNIPQDWYSEMQKSIAAAEYEINWHEETKSYSSPNRAQNLRFEYYGNGFSVSPRTERAWEVKMILTSFGRDYQQTINPGKLTATKNKAKSESDQVTLLYENTKDGMRQDFLVKEKPAGSGNLKLSIDVDSRLEFSLTADGRGIGFTDVDGQLQYRYARLKVTDAQGNELNAGMQKENDNLTIVVNDIAATYPILIDPLSTSANWIFDSEQAAAELGKSIASAGDVNGDGYSDVIVGLPKYDNGQTDEGLVYAFLGSASGLSDSPDWIVESNQASAFFGSSVASAGDVNGDGYSDVIVGAYAYDNGQTDEGRAFVYLGNSSGLSTTPIWTAENNQASSSLGISVASAGDVNGDGYSDVIIGASLFNNGETDEGRAYVYHGSSSGPSASPSWTAEINEVGSSFGFSVSSAGDVNGDGFSDVIVGAPFLGKGRVDVYHGSAAGLSTSSNWTGFDEFDSFGFGTSVSSAGDVNGDGYSDVIVGAPESSGFTFGATAYIYHGSGGGLSLSSDWNTSGFDTFGFSVSSAGDVNGDGYSDVIIGAYLEDFGWKAEGLSYLYYGSSTGNYNELQGWLGQSDQQDGNYGISVATAGDINGDGFSDVIVGASSYDSSQPNEGRVYLYYGSAGLLTNLSSPAWTEGNQTDSNFGYSVASAGDVNADGFSDVIVGAYLFDNGQSNEGRAFVFLGGSGALSTSPVWTAEANQDDAWFGISVASAGDINGDGYSDIVVGAPYYNNGQNDEGMTYVYYGSSTGPSISASWTAESDRGSALFGYSVASAGDVNRDGYQDVIIGSPNYANGQLDEGRAFVYHGGASGLSNTSSWGFESNQANALLGKSVSSAGDVNGDGYTDVIVGALLFDNGQIDEGRALVFHGSAAGLPVTSNWTAENNQAASSLGLSVSHAGDVNGDGYSDVIIGAQQGSAYVYYGSSIGLLASFSWTPSEASAGRSVATAGDVNGDGYSDILIGSSIYLGSMNGLSTNYGWNFTSADRGAAAGDVNGDGYSDVILGAPLFSNDQVNEGATFIFYGNNGGTSLKPRILRSDLTTQLGILGRTHSSSSVGASLNARSFLGRSDVKVQYEVKPLGTAFDGVDVIESDSWTDPGITGVAIGKVISGLASGDQYKIRMRIKNRMVHSVQPHGRWLYPQGNGGLGEADFLVSNANATEPVTQASNISFSNIQVGSITLQWSSGSGAGRIIVARASQALAALPIDGKTYVAGGGVFGSGSQLSPGEFVVYNGSGNTATITGLSAATTYHFRVFEYTGTSNLENYNLITAANNPNSSITLAAEPTNQATNIGFSNISSNSMTVSWTNGNGSERLLVGRAGNPVSANPLDATAYTGNANFSTATELAPGEKVLYRGSANTVNVTNLTANTTYHYRVFELNGTGTQTNYFISTDAGNPASNSTLVSEPTAQPTGIIFSSVTESSMSVSFTAAAGSPSGYLVIMKAGSSPTDVPTDGTGYTVGNMIGTSTVKHFGSGTSFSITGLVANTTYFFDLFSYNGTTGTYNYLTTAPYEGSKITTTVAPVLNAPSSFSQTSFQLSWAAVTGATDYSLDVSTDNFATFVTGYSAKLSGNTTSTNVTGLTSGTTYKARIRAINVSGPSANSNEQSALTQPSNPVLAGATAITASSITINWNPVTGATGYLLDISTDNFVNNIPGYNALAVNGNSYAATGLNPSTTYYLRLRANNGSGASGYSNIIIASTLSSEPIAQPTAFIFSNVTTSSLSGSFTMATGSPSGYLVLYRSGSSPTDIPVDGTIYAVGNTIGSSIVAHIGSATSFTLTGLSPNQTYFFDVFSFNGTTGTYNYLTSSPLQASTSTLTTEPSGQPTNMLFSNVTVNSLTASFTAASGSPTGYLVLRKSGSAPGEIPTDGTEYTEGNALGSSTIIYTGSTPSFPDSGLLPGTTYYYVVFAYNGSTGTYNYLSTTPLQGNQITIPAQPVLNVPSLQTQNSFQLTWASVTGATDYALDVSIDNFNTYVTGYAAKLLGNVPSASVTGLASGTNYKARIRAINTAGASENSVSQSALTRPSNPVLTPATEINSNSFVINWSAVNGATGFLLDISIDNFVNYVPGYNGLFINGAPYTVTSLSPSTTYKVRLRSSNSAGASGNSNEISVTTLAGSTSPLAIGTLSYSTRQDNITTQTLNIPISGGIAPYTVVVRHKAILKTDFTVAPALTPVSGNYSFDITPDMLDKLGVDFEVKVTDGTGSSDQDNGRIYTAFNDAQSPVIPFSNFGGTDATWNLFSIPYELDVKTVGSIFDGYDQARHEYDWKIVRYRNSSNDYGKFNTGQVKVGEGYWFNAKVKKEVKIGAGQTTSLIPFQLSLLKGWNLIGNPYPVDISWNEVLAENASVTGVETLQVFNGTSQAPGDIIKPFGGGFVWSDDAAQVTIDPLKVSTGGRVSSRKGKIENLDIDGVEWMVPLRLLRQGVEVEIGGFGMHPQATSSKDIYDRMTVPRFFQYTDLATEHPDYFYPWFSTDVVSTQASHTWSFTLSTNQKENIVQLLWDHVTLQRTDADLFLLDKSSGKLINMKLQGNHSIDLGKGTFQFDIYYSATKEPFQPTQLILGDAFPNPAISYATIPLVLPKDSGEIELSVYDMTGKKVTTLAQGVYDAGAYEFTWQPSPDLNKNMSGLFIYRLQFMNNDHAPMQKKLIIR